MGVASSPIDHTLDETDCADCRQHVPDGYVDLARGPTMGECRERRNFKTPIGPKLVRRELAERWPIMPADGATWRTCPAPRPPRRTRRMRPGTASCRGAWRFVRSEAGLHADHVEGLGDLVDALGHARFLHVAVAHALAVEPLCLGERRRGRHLRGRLGELALVRSALLDQGRMVLAVGRMSARRPDDQHRVREGRRNHNRGRDSGQREAWNEHGDLLSWRVAPTITWA